MDADIPPAVLIPYVQLFTEDIAKLLDGCKEGGAFELPNWRAVPSR